MPKSWCIKIPCWHDRLIGLFNRESKLAGITKEAPNREKWNHEKSIGLPVSTSPTLQFHEATLKKGFMRLKARSRKYTQKCDHDYSLLQAYPGWCKEPTTSTEWPPASFSHFGLEGLHGTWPVLQSCHGRVWAAMWQVFLLSAMHWYAEQLRCSYAAMCVCMLGACPTQIENSPKI